MFRSHSPILSHLEKEVSIRRLSKEQEGCFTQVRRIAYYSFKFRSFEAVINQFDFEECKIYSDLWILDRLSFLLKSVFNPVTDKVFSYYCVILCFLCHLSLERDLIIEIPSSLCVFSLMQKLAHFLINRQTFILILNLR